MNRATLYFLVMMLVAACSEPDKTSYVIDLKDCTVAGRSMLEVLQWDPSESEPSQQTRLYQQFAQNAADHGVYFGLCGIDVEHGQAMALRIPDLELSRPGFKGWIKPSISGNTTILDIVNRYGQPISKPGSPVFSEVRRTGGRVGKFADWSSICDGLTMRLDFNHRDRLSAITIYPTPTSE